MLIFWGSQFLELMKMKNGDFSSREDKVIWVVVMIFLNAFGALLFCIQFRPENERVKVQVDQLAIELYEKIKSKFPDYQREIDLAIKMKPYERYGVEKWYRKKANVALKKQYQQGADKINPACFGILLAILETENIEI